VSDAMTSTPSEISHKSSWQRVLLVNAPYILIYVLTVWLVALTDRDPATAARYWQYFVPVVGLVAVIGGWSRSRESRSRYLTEQLLHWGSVMLVVYLLFTPSMQQFLNADSHGFVIAYVLGLAAILSGIYQDWKMGVFGLFLVGSAVGIGMLEDNAMLLTLIGVGTAAIAITLLIRKSGRL
jgi:Na+/melibiose symporter-like transporter